MTDVLCVIGTRPDAIKTKPVANALRAAGLSVAALATGQHPTLLDVGDAVPTLGIPGGNILKFLSRARHALRERIIMDPPRCVLVQGDTMSSLAAALAAADVHVPIAHVEAGVRSGDVQNPWPEELIRIEIDRLATWRYAPTITAANNLVQEFAPNAANAAYTSIAFVTGNTGIDVLRTTFADITTRAEASPTLLVTLHRRELRARADVREVLQALFDAVAASHVSAVWPVHPGMHGLLAGLRIPPNFSVRPPMTHDVLLHTLTEARGVLTDSGGLVEEAAHYGVPTAILRSANDRPEAVEAGIARMFAPTPRGAQDAVATLATCAIPRRPAPVFGDGYASERIATHLAEVLKT